MLVFHFPFPSFRPRPFVGAGCSFPKAICLAHVECFPQDIPPVSDHPMDCTIDPTLPCPLAYRVADRRMGQESVPSCPADRSPPSTMQTMFPDSARGPVSAASASTSVPSEPQRRRPAMHPLPRSCNHSFSVPPPYCRGPPLREQCHSSSVRTSIRNNNPEAASVPPAIRTCHRRRRDSRWVPRIWIAIARETPPRRTRRRRRV
mmetsp:Transcript_1698/g.3183  ORF Transcript_1698/g.3183 Transcript_1698/m.3183 type:complete len:204 (-) Transcript_1698:730-1341(-)